MCVCVSVEVVKDLEKSQDFKATKEAIGVVISSAAQLVDSVEQSKAEICSETNLWNEACIFDTITDIICRVRDEIIAHGRGFMTTSFKEAQAVVDALPTVDWKSGLAKNAPLDAVLKEAESLLFQEGIGEKVIKAWNEAKKVSSTSCVFTQLQTTPLSTETKPERWWAELWTPREEEGGGGTCGRQEGEI